MTECQARPVRASRPLDQLDAVAVRVPNEAQPRASLADAVGRFLGLDALVSELRQHRVEVLDGDGYVVVAAAQLIRVDAVVVRQLEPRPVAVESHEDVDRLVTDRRAPDLLHPEGFVEGHRAVDVSDAVAGMDQLTHRRPPRSPWWKAH